MTKTYKHRTLGWIYERLGDNYNPVVNQTHNWPMMPFSIIPELIENSSDREEVVEKYWVEMCVDEIFEYQRWRPWDEPDYVSIRKIIEKHAPKQKKFTNSEVFKFWQDNRNDRTSIGTIVWCVNLFLKQNNLLSDTD